MPEKIKIHLSFMIGLICSLAVSQTAASTDLLTIIEHAEDNDVEYREIQYLTKASATQVPLAKSALFLPKIRLSASKRQVGQDITLNQAFGAGGKTNFTATSYRINLTQPVYHHDKIIDLFQSKKILKKAQLELVEAHQDLIYRATENYFNVLSSKDKLKFAHSELLSLQGQLERAKQRFDVGLIAITDVQEATAGYDRAFARKIQAQNEVQNAMESLRKVTGSYYEEIAPLGDSFQLKKATPDNIKEWADRAIVGNLKVALANTDVQIQKDEIKKVKAKYFPSIDIVGGHGMNKQGGRFGSSEIDQTDIGLELSVPIFLGGEVIFNSKKEKQKYKAALSKLESLQRSAIKDARESFLGIETQMSLVGAFGRSVISAETSLESIKAGFQVGTRTTIDIVDAESVLSQARRDLQLAKYNYILSSFKLKRAVGSLNSEDVGNINNWLVIN